MVSPVIDHNLGLLVRWPFSTNKLDLKALVRCIMTVLKSVANRYLSCALVSRMLLRNERQILLAGDRNNAETSFSDRQIRAYRRTTCLLLCDDWMR
jgi:hypothetical protein